jgi:4-amino-4-deoxy-L-arabinose transferase-like glycosyltransferase
MNLLTLIGSVTILISLTFFKVASSATGIFTKKLAAIPEKWFLACLALVFFAVTCALSGMLFSHVPHVADSQSQYIQSKIFTSGQIYITPHPLQKFFNTQAMASWGNYYSLYPPGHAILLAIGQLIGMPWVINPTLGALFTIAVYYLSRELTGPATARLAAILALLSPFIVFMSSEYMNHATSYC